MASRIQTAIDPFILDQASGGGGEDPDGNDSRKEKPTREHAVEGTTIQALGIAAAVAAFMKAQKTKGKDGKMSTSSGVTKAGGTEYKTSSEHRAHSKKWHVTKNEIIEDRRRTINSMLHKSRRITEAQVTQVSGRVGTIAQYDGIIAQLAENEAREAASNTVMATDGGTGTDGGTTLPTEGQGDMEDEETEDQDAEGDEEEGEEEGDDDADAANTLIATLQAIFNTVSTLEESSKGRVL